MSIYNSPYFLFKAGSLKGKSRKEIDAFFKRQKDQAKKPKPKQIDPLVKRKAQLAKQYKKKTNKHARHFNVQRWILSIEDNVPQIYS